MVGRGATRQARQYPLLALFVYLTFLGGTFYSDLNLSLRVLHQAIITGLLVLWLIILVREGQNWPRTGLEVPILVLLMWRLFSCLTSVNPRMSFELLWRPVTHVIGFYWLVWSMRRMRWWRVIHPLYLTAGVVCLVGLFEFVGWYFGVPFLPVFKEGWLQIGGITNPLPPVQWRLNFTLSNATSLSAYLALLIPPALVMGIVARRKDSRIGWLGWVLVAVVVQLLTRSRGGLLSLAVSLSLLLAGIAALFWPAIGDWFRSPSRRRLVWLPIVLLVLVVVVGGVLLKDQVTGRLQTVLIRFELWRCAAEMVIRQPLLGVGNGVYGQELRGCLASHAIYSGSYEQFTTAHNLYLNLAAESGLVALGALFWGGWLLVRMTWKRWQMASDRRERLVVLGVGSALAGYGANCLVDTLPATPLVLPVLALTAWLVFPVGMHQPTPERKWRFVPFVAAGVLLAFAAWFVQVDRGQLHFEKVVRAADGGRWPQALTEIRRAEEFDVGLGLYRFQEAYILGQLAAAKGGDWVQEAIEVQARALQLDDTNSLHLANLAVLEWQAGRTETAIGTIQRAVGANPPDAMIWLNLGKMSEIAGGDDQARAAYAEALAMEPAWAGSGYWCATSWREDNWQKILEAAAQKTDDPAGLWLAASRTADAIAVAQQAIQQDPARVSGYLALGNAYLTLGDLARAERAAETAVEMNPGHAQALLLRSQVRLAKGDVSGAELDAKTALFINPYGVAKSNQVLGQIALLAGDDEAAEAYFLQGVAPLFVSQNWDVVMYNRKALFLPLPQMEQIAGGVTHFEAWLDLAELYRENGESDAEEQLYRLILERDPYFPEVEQLAGSVDL